MTDYALFYYGEQVSQKRKDRAGAIDEAFRVVPVWHLLDGYKVKEVSDAALQEDKP